MRSHLYLLAWGYRTVGEDVKQNHAGDCGQADYLLLSRNT
jgi:hypothetical protein